MATPRRRSSRLKGLSSPQKVDTNSTHLNAVLEDAVSNDESVRSQTPGATTFISNIPTLSATPSMNSIKTPTTATRFRASPEEMHPSRFQSAAKKAASGKRLSIVNNQVYRASTEREEHITSSPTRPSFASPGFQFRYRQSTDLSSEAQRMMDEVREQAARMKGAVDSGRKEQLRKEEEAEVMYGRRLATPKGKLGRYSDVHLDEFKKMNSIANHPSTCRVEPVVRNPPIFKIAQTEDENTKPSQDDPATESPWRSLKRTHSKVDLLKPEPAIVQPHHSTSHLDEEERKNESPAKRFKQSHEAAVAARAATMATPNKAYKSTLSRIDSGIPTLPSLPNLTTPSKIPLARSASVKSLKAPTSQLPTLSRTPSTKTLATPTHGVHNRIFSHTEGNKRYRDSLARGFTRVKSILRQPQLRFSDDPAKVAAGTHLSTPKGTPTKATSAHALQTLTEDIPSTPGTPSFRKEKHVNFSPAVIEHTDRSGPCSPATPSPIKIPGSFPVTYPTLALPNISDVFNTPTRATAGTTTAVRASGAVPGDFTFRADQAISFSPTSNHTPTIRRVRTSDVTALMSLTNANAASKNGFEALPHIDHGLSNKKRKRDSAAKVDEGDQMNATLQDDKENADIDMGANSDLEQRGSPAKKARVTLGPAPVKRAPSAMGAVAKAKMTPAAVSRLPKRKGGSVLSLSRLNALAMPRARK